MIRKSAQSDNKLKNGPPKQLLKCYIQLVKDKELSTYFCNPASSGRQFRRYLRYTFNNRGKREFT